MSAVDFEAWAAPDLVLTLGGRTYKVRAPSVDAAKKVLAATVKAEVQFGLADGPIPEPVQRILETIGEDEHPALGDDVYEQLVADGASPVTIDRMAVYALFFWARGREYADALATILFSPRSVDEGPAEASPKARPTSPPSNGRSTGSGNR